MSDRIINWDETMVSGSSCENFVRELEHKLNEKLKERYPNGIPDTVTTAELNRALREILASKTPSITKEVDLKWQLN